MARRNQVSKTLTRTVLFSQISVSTVEIPNAYPRQSKKIKKNKKKPQLATESQPKEKKETRN